MSGGHLYGVTEYAGAAGAGTIFQLSSPQSGIGPWTQSVLYNFSGGRDGTAPFAAPVVGSDGAL